MRELIQKSLSTRIDGKVVDALLQSYEKGVARFQKGDLDSCLGAAGKFVEHTLRAVEYVRTGVAPAEIKAPSQTIREIEKDHKLPEGLRVLIPRIAHSMIYEIRSKRGAIHVKEIDPRQIDAALAVQASSWVLAEFIRLYHQDDEAGVARAMATLMHPHVPFIEHFGGESAVTRKVRCEVELLLLLTQSAPDGLDRTALGRTCKFPPSTVTRTLQRLQDERLVHLTREGRFHITGPGEQHLLSNLADEK